MVSLESWGKESQRVSLFLDPFFLCLNVFTAPNLSLKFPQLAELCSVNWCLGCSQSCSVHWTSPDHSCPSAKWPKAATMELLS